MQNPTQNAMENSTQNPTQNPMQNPTQNPTQNILAGLVEDPVIKAIARLEFEDGLRTRVLLGGCWGP